MTVFTIGYEGLSIDAFMSLLSEYGIETVVDIRELPLSRKTGFSKKMLANLLKLAGYNYLHMAALGCPRTVRDRYRLDKDWKNYTEGFLVHLATQQNAIAELSGVVSTANCALLCYEADYNFCHRSMVAYAVHDLCGAEVRHIRARKIGVKTTKVAPPLLAFA